ncbi:hypothetical protein CU254_40965 (plasmid) [Amycolatopsis sp. AA4]|uniref:hypothetical protein n=1 Tax=Actinomycetes TaxID=1760 RepID=UPI0001B56189|nr:MULTISPECIES: hypothetical protein [Actinomycetes]ATY16966.1 hypothetical protein CU254_40965 [Amycolatopsis sp. AA4]
MSTPADRDQSTANGIRHDVVGDRASDTPRVGEPGGGQGLERLRRALLDRGASTQEIAEILARRRGLGALSAWRHALGLTRGEVAARYNAVVARNPERGRTVSVFDRGPMTAELLAVIEADGNEGRGFLSRKEAAVFAEIFQTDPETLRYVDAQAGEMMNVANEGELSLRPGEHLVSIYTTADDGTPLQDAVVDLLETCGLEADLWDIVFRGSWFRRFRARAQDHAVADKLADLAGKLERAAELKYIDTPRSESDVREANAVAQLLQHTAADEEVVICLSSVLFVRTQGTVVVKVLSENEIRALKQHPHLLKAPAEILDSLARLQKPAPLAPGPNELTATLPPGQANRPTG